MAPSIAAMLKVARILWLSLSLSTLMFLVMYAMTRQGRHDPPDAIMIAVTAAAAFGLAVASVFLPSRAFAIALRRLDLAIASEAGEPIGSFRESAPVRRVVADPEAAVRGAFPAFQTSFIVGMALAEAVALLGFALGFIGAPVPVMVPFFLVAWALMATKLPRLGQITRAIERATGAHCQL